MSSASVLLLRFVAVYFPGLVWALIVRRCHPALLEHNFPAPESGVLGWVSFFSVAGLLGLVASALGSIMFDRISDGIYRKSKRVKRQLLESGSGRGARISIFLRRWYYTLRNRPSDFFPTRPLEWAADLCKERCFAGENAALGQYCNEVQPLSGHRIDTRICNTYWWAASMVRMRNSAGVVAIETTQAAWIVFRGLAVVTLFVLFSQFLSARSAAETGHLHLHDAVEFLAWLLLGLVFLHRYCKLRYLAEELAFIYYIGQNKEMPPPAQNPEIAPQTPRAPGRQGSDRI